MMKLVIEFSILMAFTKNPARFVNCYRYADINDILINRGIRLPFVASLLIYVFDRLLGEFYTYSSAMNQCIKWVVSTSACILT